MRRRGRSQQGFTLIELLIVVAIIGILAAIVVPMYHTYRVKAYNASAQTDLRNLKTLMESVYDDTQEYPSL